MNRIDNCVHPMTKATLLVSLAMLTSAAVADDSEIFVAETTTAPNIMLILDTSGSMHGQVTSQEPYDPNRNYLSEATGNCANISGRVFYKTSNPGTPPRCNSSAHFPEADLKCAAAINLMNSSGAAHGGRYMRWGRSSSSNTQRWRNLTSVTNIIGTGSRYDVECREDHGVDGDLESTAPYIDRDATGNRNRWTSTPTAWPASDGTAASLYSANYIAYYEQFRTQRLGTRMEIMQQAARNLLYSLSNVNVGLMRYSTNSASNNSDGGGMVLWPVSPIEESRDQIINLIDGLVPYYYTPLSETLFEAYRYFSGGQVHFGNTSRTCTESYSNGNCSGSVVALPSAAESRVGNAITGTHYASPAGDSCQKNFIVYLTDGEPTRDNKADALIEALGSATGGCDEGSNPGRCLAAIAQYMHSTDLREDVPGDQTVSTYFIGFGDTFGGTSNSAFSYLQEAAERGNGEAFQANDLSELSAVFTNIFSSILDQSTTLTAPTVSVNAFNRTQTLDELYVSVFQPAAATHWPGNVKKYRVDPSGQLVDRSGNPAVNPATGFFRDSTSDIWSATNSDGAAVVRGGAANRIPSPATRNVYTYIGSNPGTPVDLTSHVNHSVATNNTLITDAHFGTNADADPLRDKLIEWARGADVNDTNTNGNTTEARLAFGDPMHAQPAVVIYGGTVADPDLDDAVVFAATNDGYLHAVSAETGAELWTYIPQELLPQLLPLYQDANTSTKHYGLDGDLRVLKYDVNGDGIVDPDSGDRVFLFFSTGRNALTSNYYALDVTDKSRPRFMWSIGANELPDLGQAWSAPTITRVNINGATQNSQKLTLVFGGGYDPAEEAGPYISTSSVGNRIYMVDALYGTLLWSAGLNDSNLNLSRMTHSIPASISVLDLDGDGTADRMYAADMAAQLWRFDIHNGQAADSLVTGGVIASLGAKDISPRTIAHTRRFYNAPDTAAVQIPGHPLFINIAIGSGYRGHPLRITTEDRFYSIRDMQPFAKFTQTQYDTRTVILDADLIDVTTNMTPAIPSTASGWKMRLDQPNNDWRGEKVLAKSNTFMNQIFFTTYTPSPSTVSNACTLAVGSNRAYAVNVLDGTPRRPQRDGETEEPGPGEEPGDDPWEPSPEDRYEELAQGGIAPEVSFLFPAPNEVICLSGVEVLSACTNFNSRVKTYWRESTAP